MTDIAIIGAGAAGLGAAKEAMARGLSVVVLEASGFVGGRARTDHTTLGAPFDLGCHWLQGGDANPFRATATAAGARLGPAIDRYAFHDGQGFCRADANAAGNRSFERFEIAVAEGHRQLSTNGTAAERSVAAAIDAEDPWAGYFLRLLHHECAADPRAVSLADPTATLFGSADVPVLTGYGDLIRTAAQAVPVTLNCPVTCIDLGGPRVALHTPQGPVEADAAIVTVSTAVLAAERLTLKPGGWPSDKIAAIDATPTGSSTKVGLRFAGNSLQNILGTAARSGRRDIVVQCALPEPQNVFWHLGTGDGDLAVAYFGGSFSRELALAGEAEQTAWAKRHLADLLGAAVEPLLLGACTTPFDRDPWIGGGYSYCRLGSGNQRAALARPIDNRVFFAGEAAAADYPTTAHGAWLSGRAAARQIAAAIGRA